MIDGNPPLRISPLCSSISGLSTWECRCVRCCEVEEIQDDEVDCPLLAQLVPAVTELMVAELLYLEKQGSALPIEMLINSSGTTRQDGEIVGQALPC